ncbi:hypothetical protein Pcinc_032717 [Petrolisthes cinctipes]|uniref:Transmembrane protein 45B n=1 Tax=Petrolisthes cinctipes TaxID=88211 RepID=A0AAE1ETH6_PETCI|nr:hypothetical protein Pcinc_032717 [Petrolisthes cinctipes]
MGSFEGHAQPGTFFFMFGCWFTYQVFLKYFLCQRAKALATSGGKGRSRLYHNTSSFSSPCCRVVPLEGILKITVALVGMTGEFVTGFDEQHHLSLHNAQHMTMFFFFGVNGATDIVTHYRLPVPPDLDYVSGLLALVMEGLLFFYHLHGRPPMDVQVHMLLFYVVMACAASIFFEMCHKSNVLPALCRSYFTLLQGTWFYQIGFVLYPPSGWETWEQHDHHQMMLVTLLFTWHNATIFLLMSLAGSLVYLRVKKMPPAVFYRYLMYYHLTPPSASCLVDPSDQSKAMLVNDSEEEEV